MTTQYTTQPHTLNLSQYGYWAQQTNQYYQQQQQHYQDPTIAAHHYNVVVPDQQRRYQEYMARKQQNMWLRPLYLFDSNKPKPPVHTAQPKKKKGFFGMLFSEPGKLFKGLANAAVNFAYGATVGFATNLVRGALFDENGNFSIGKALLTAAVVIGVGALMCTGAGAFVGLGLAGLGLTMALPGFISSASDCVQNVIDGDMDALQVNSMKFGEKSMEVGTCFLGWTSSVKALKAARLAEATNSVKGSIQALRAARAAGNADEAAKATEALKAAWAARRAAQSELAAYSSQHGTWSSLFGGFRPIKSVKNLFAGLGEMAPGSGNWSRAGTALRNAYPRGVGQADDAQTLLANAQRLAGRTRSVANNPADEVATVVSNNPVDEVATIAANNPADEIAALQQRVSRLQNNLNNATNTRDQWRYLQRLARAEEELAQAQRAAARAARQQAPRPTGNPNTGASTASNTANASDDVTRTAANTANATDDATTAAANTANASDDVAQAAARLEELQAQRAALLERLSRAPVDEPHNYASLEQSLAALDKQIRAAGGSGGGLFSRVAGNVRNGASQATNPANWEGLRGRQIVSRTLGNAKEYYFPRTVRYQEGSAAGNLFNNSFLGRSVAPLGHYGQPLPALTTMVKLDCETTLDPYSQFNMERPAAGNVNAPEGTYVDGQFDPDSMPEGMMPPGGQQFAGMTNYGPGVPVSMLGGGNTSDHRGVDLSRYGISPTSVYA